ncbi:MAG: glycosyltransferase family 39 protein [Chloroflexota bacterium]
MECRRSSGLFINYARDLRMYALIACLSIVSWWFFLQFIEKKRGRLGYIATVGLMAYTYYYGAFVVLAQGVYLLIFERRALGRWLRSLIWVALAFVVWIPAFINQLSVARMQSGDPNAPLLGKFLGTEATGLGAVIKLIQAYSAGEVSWLALLLLLSVTGLALLPRLKRRNYGALLLWLVFALTAFFVLNLVVPIYGIRYTLPLFPALALLIGVGVLALPRRWTQIAFIILIGVVGIVTQTEGYQTPRAPHHELLLTVEQQYLPGDRIWYLPPLYAAGSNIWDEAIYHLKTEFPQLSTDWFVWDAPQDFADPAVTPRVWDVRAYWMPMLDTAVKPLTSTRTLSEKTDFDEYTVRLYEAPPNAAPVSFAEGFNLLPGEVVNLDHMLAPRLWWQAARTIDRDYSYTLLLEDANGTVVASQDASILTGGVPNPLGLTLNQDTPGVPSSAWLPGQAYQLMTPMLKLPAGLAPGSYTFWLGVYYWQTPTRLVPLNLGAFHTDANRDLINLGTVEVDS